MIQVHLPMDGDAFKVSSRVKKSSFLEIFNFYTIK